jgi:Leucine-rich repeat (LRR) protein
MNLKTYLLLILFFIVVKPCKTTAQVNPQDSSVLVNIYNNYNGPAGWTVKWDLTTPVSTWYGITVTNGRVTALNLSGNNLSGDFGNADVLSGLTELTDLELGNDQLTGSIPSSLGNLSNLQYLVLDGNQLSDSIPFSLGNLSNLQSLYLFANQLSDSIPTSLGNLINLTDLELYDNKLTGSIPSSLGNLSRLNFMELYDNQLSDSIPSSLGNLSNLTDLGLYNNQLSGSIPDSLSNLSNLTGLFLDQNLLTGSIPSSLGNLSNLNFLGLSDNQLSGNIPSSLGNLSNLNSIDLFDNPLSGSIPSSLGNLLNLNYINLSRDHLSDSIPSSIGNLSLVSYFDLSYNQLSGNVPASMFSNYSTINYLLLNDNQLSGALPFPASNFSSIIFFTLFDNRFTFAGMEDIVKTPLSPESPGVAYFPQATIPLNIQGNLLSVSAGGTLANDTFYLYKNDVLNSTQIGDSVFAVNSGGNYFITVTNAITSKLILYTDTIKIDTVTIQLCPPVANTLLIADSTGSVYQWQLNSGNGFVNISDDSNYVGTTTGSLQLNNIPSSYYGYQYRCTVDGNNSTPFTLKFTDEWTGAIDSSWATPGNWNCGSVPDAYTDAIINNGTVILFSDGTCRSLLVDPASNITVNFGAILTVTH